MWSNYFRLCLFSLIYQEIFLATTDPIKESNNSQNWDKNLDEFFTIMELEFAVEFDIELDELGTNKEEYLNKLAIELTSQMQSFMTDKDAYSDILKNNLESWTNTFNIIKSILYCFLMEQKHFGENAKFEKNIFGVYIKLAEDFTVAANVKFVHAILAKIINKKLQIDTK